MTTELQPLLEPVRELAVDAGKRIMDIYETAFDIEHKDDKSPLTTADLASHQAIVQGLRELTPEIPVLSEESAAIPYEERRHWRRFWLVDPLDGTKEFIKRNGEFTVNIALVEEGRPVLGVVEAPAKGVCYWAAQGVGAFRRQGEGPAQAIQVARYDGRRPVRVVGSRSHAGPELTAWLQRLGEHELVSIGSSLKLCLVADGEADIYPRLGPTSEWDTAAAHCVVEQAGGRVLAVGDGRSLVYNKESVLNPYFLVTGDADRDWLSDLA